MSLLKKKLKILILLVLLLGTIAVPTLFTTYYNRSYFDKTTLFTVQTGSLEDSISSGDLWERLQILKDNVLVRTQGENGGQALMVWSRDPHSNVSAEAISYVEPQGDKSETEAELEAKEKSNTEIKNTLARQAQKQLRKLQKYHVFPDLSFSGLRNIAVAKQIYMDKENPAATFSVWEIFMSYPDFFAMVYMDTETLALCQVTLSPTKSPFVYEKTSLSPDGFLEYLNTFSQVPGDHADREERFHAEGIFSPSQLCLYTVSTDRQGSHLISYRLDAPL